MCFLIKKINLKKPNVFLMVRLNNFSENIAFYRDLRLGQLFINNTLNEQEGNGY